MHNIRPFPTVKTDDLNYGRQFPQRITAAPNQTDREQFEAFLLDTLSMILDPRGDYDFHAGVTSGPRQSKSVRPEIPILCDQKQETGLDGRRHRAHYPHTL
jgi:hypothetical protein